MGGQSGELSGPDLTKGISSSELADGATLLGHAGGEAVLLARRGSDVFAVGATCTHYSGPLAEGLFVGHTVRCPWHHACFDLKSGEPLRAPALNPIPCFEVERDGDRIKVGQKLVVPRRTRGDVAPKRVVIVGAGAAGNSAAEMLRREGYEGSIDMFGKDPSVPVDRPNLSKDYLAGTAPEEWIPLRPESFYEEQTIHLVRGARVASIDVAAKRVVLEDGSAHAYDALLLATGAEPVHLTIPGADLPHVHVLRTLADSRAIIAGAEGKKRAVVMGASFIGLEVAASLRARGLEVHVVAPEQRPLERVVGKELGDFIRKLHEEHGVVFHLGETATKIDAKEVTLKGGAVLTADLVVTGVGVRPAVELAERAGIACDRGVLVNERLETSAPGVFAAGDIARWPDPHTGQRIRVEHWVVAQRQGQVAARNILGGRVPFDAVPFFWSAHYDVTIAYVGHAEKWDEIVVRGDIAKRDCAVAFRAGKKTLAVATIGRDAASLAIEAAMEQNDQTAIDALMG